MTNHINQRTEFLPVSINVTNKKLLIIGGGNAALSKLKSLSRFNVSITVIGIKIDSAFLAFENIHIIQKSFDPSDLEGFFMVYACTDNAHTNQIISEHCHERGILATQANSPAKSDFVSPAIYKKDDLTVAVGSNGKNVKQSVNIRDLIKKNLAPVSEKYLESAAKYYKGNECSRIISENPANGQAGRVVLAGFGPGDPGLMTLKTNQYLLNADVILHDALLNTEFLNQYPALKIAVGKRCGQHNRKQEEINQLLVNYALEGKQVVRLKGGDPLIFGRAGEELEVLSENGIAVEVVPGITSAFAAAAQFGIPLTHRDIGSSLAFCVGHNISGKPLPQANTLVFYMGANQQCEISKALIKDGWHKSTPVALLSNISNHNSKAVFSQLDKLCSDELLPETPLLIIVGEVVNKIPEMNGKRKAPARIKGSEPRKPSKTTLTNVS